MADYGLITNNEDIIYCDFRILSQKDLTQIFTKHFPIVNMVFTKILISHAYYNL